MKTTRSHLQFRAQCPVGCLLLLLLSQTTVRAQQSTTASPATQQNTTLELSATTESEASGDPVFVIDEECRVPTYASINYETVFSAPVANDSLLVVEGQCYIACMESLDDPSAGFADHRNRHTQYPPWPYFTLEKRYCGVHQYVHECTRGCVIKSTTSENCEIECLSHCSSECGHSSLPFPLPSCNNPDFDELWVWRDCPLTCDYPRCSAGCRIDKNVHCTSDCGPPLTPEAPPTLTPVVNSTRAGMYTIDLTHTVPSSPLLSHGVVFLFEIQDNTTGNYSYYWMVDPRTSTLDLADFSCRDVTVRFAVGNLNGLSGFSESFRLLQVYGVPEGIVSCQLESFQSNVSADPDNFRYQVIELSWDPPCRSEAIENYFINVTSVPVCGRIPDVTLSKNATNYTIRGPEKFNPNDVIGPITQCTYSITITVLPRGLDDGNPPNRPVYSGTYPEPSNGDMELECSSMANQRTGSYNLTVRIVLSALFTPVVLTQYISHFQLNRTSYDLSTDADTVIPMAPSPIHNILKKNGSFELETTFIGVPSLGFNQEYRFSATVGFEANVPRGSYLGESTINRDISTLCHLPDVGPVPPGNILNVSSTVVGLPYESSATGQRIVFADVNVTWSRPELEGSGIKDYQITVRQEPLKLNDTSTIDIHTVSENVLSIQQPFSFNVLLDTFTIFTQVRARTRNQLPGLWSEPVEVNVFIPTPPGTMEPYQHFNVTQYSHRINLKDNQLSMLVDIQFIPPTIFVDTMNQLQFRFYGGDVELDPLRKTNQITTLNPTEVNQVYTDRTTFMIQIPDEQNGTRVDTFVQMQAFITIGPTIITGNWSEPAIVPIVIAFSPEDILINQIVYSAVIVEDIELRMSLSLGFSDTISPCSSDVLNTLEQQAMRQACIDVTRYSIAVGTQPINETFGTVPSDTVVIDFKGDTLSGIWDVTLTFHREEDVLNRTLYLQVWIVTFYSSSTGTWSDPKSILVPSNLEIRSPEPPCGNLETILGVVITASVALILQMVIVLVCCILYNQKKKSWQLSEYAEALPYPSFIELKSTRKKTILFQSQVRELVKLIPDSLKIPRTHLKMSNTFIGQGEFGIVYKGLLLNWNNIPVQGVAVKALKGLFTLKDVESMVNEIIKMQEFKHPHVLPLIGVCLDTGPGVSMVMPYMTNGSLLCYLKKERSNLEIKQEDNPDRVPIVRRLLLRMCHQIALGMKYLTEQKFIHRDLAARNCMLDSDGNVKVGDFGLAEDVYSCGYFKQTGKGNIKLPYKWMALESLSDNLFSEKTDVWSYGVTIWEIFSGGRNPYPGVDPMSLVFLLKDGKRLETPPNAACSPEIFAVMSQCWNKKPFDRPHFSKLSAVMDELLSQVSGYTELRMVLAEDHEQPESQEYKFIA